MLSDSNVGKWIGTDLPAHGLICAREQHHGGGAAPAGDNFPHDFCKAALKSVTCGMSGCSSTLRLQTSCTCASDNFDATECSPAMSHSDAT